MLKQATPAIVKKRTLQEKLFKSLCKGVMLLYILIIVFFVFIILKSGINSFLATKVKITSEDELQAFASIISHNKRNVQRLEQVENGKMAWFDTKGNFSIYYKNKEKYNENWNAIIQKLKQNNGIKVRSSFNIIRNFDSTMQEEAGLLGAIKGTLLVTVIFLTFASIIGIATGVYLTEFAKNKKIVNLININISNLASIPPIIYGIFGINFLINNMHIPRSSSLLGGLIIGLLTLPIIVIVTSDSLKNVPSHLKFSAKALGLTNMQTVFRVCLPFAFPRILTGILLTLSRGISEATPLILVGMASFIQSPPSGFEEPATTIATQIYLWITNPDSAFIEKAYGSIFVLLVIVGSINLFASIIRYKVLKKTAVR